MDCPECKCKTIVIDSRKYPGGEVRRRRKCKECGLRFSTLECVFRFDERQIEIMKKIWSDDRETD